MPPAPPWPLFKGSPLPQLVYLFLIHGAVFRESSVYSGPISDHMLAVMGHAAPAGRTGSAVTVGIHAHPVARPIIHDRFADSLHDAGELMPQYGGRGDLRRALVPLMLLLLLSFTFLSHLRFCFMFHLRFLFESMEG